MLTIPDDIKGLLHLDNCKKNTRIHFPNGERSDICNDQIVLNSVKFTESLCSRNTLKFGLCEASVFECEVVGVSNVKGATIEVYCEVYCDSSVSGAVWRVDLEEWVYPILYGCFIITEAKRQADIIHRKIVAYNYLYNAYLDLNQKDSFMIFEMSEITETGGSHDVGLETLIYETYPDLFNAHDYNYVQKYLKDQQMHAGNPVRWWKFKNHVGPNFYHDCKIRLYKCHLYFGKNTDNLALIDFEHLNVKDDSAIDEFLYDIKFMLYYNFPDAREYDDPYEYFDFSVIDEYEYLDYKPVIVYDRSDYISASLDNLKRRTFTNGKWIIFNSGSSQSFEGNNAGYYFTVYDEYTQEETDVIGGIFKWYDDESYFYEVPISEVKQTSYTLVKTKDSYTEQGFWGGTVTCSGYSYRKALENVNIYNLMQAYAEIKGFFWNLSRNKPKKINIKQQFALLPSNTLYPDSNLYPEGVTGGKLLPQDYQSCWYDDSYTRPFGAVRCKYKNTYNDDCIFTLYLNGFDEDSPEDSYQIYSIDNNYIIQNSTWTQAQIEAICSTIAANISGVAYMPVEFIGRGLPYVEAGDTFEILTGSNDSITTIVLRRTLSGEMVLTDSYKSV